MTNIGEQETVGPDASTLAADAEDFTRALKPGTDVGAFKIVRELGRGGMGTVYLARDTGLGRRVALKFPAKSLTNHQGAVERFFAEARVTATFSHPNIVGLHTVGEYRGQPFVVLEYIEGESLRERIKHNPPTGRAALRLVRSIVDGVREAHRHGVFHRDLKPENVLIGKDGRVRVADFGLAIQGSIDGIAAVEGTVLYMAPEQWLGQPEAASDVWAIGLMLHELLTAQLPYRGLTQAARVSALFDESPVPINRATLAEPIADLLAACLHKDPLKRLTAAQLFDRLERLVGDQPQQGLTENEGPFRGLFAFDERHAASFFGRESEITAAVERLRDEPLLAIVAPSGTGKSSFVRAGVVPRLREQERWTLVVVRPGASPFEALAAALQGALAERSLSTGMLYRNAQDKADSVLEHNLAQRLLTERIALSQAMQELARALQSRVLLFVDALEELHTHDVAASVRSAFFEAIAGVIDESNPELRVILALRDDFLGRTAQSTKRSLFDRIFVLRDLDATALESVLTRPLELYGYRFDDPSLPAQMVQEIQGEVAALPLLQFAADQLWTRRDRQAKLLTRKSYDAQGGVSGALVRHADSVLAALLHEQVELARVLLLRLVTPQKTRRAVLMSALVQGLSEKAPAVVDRLSRGRLLTFRRGVGEDHAVELVHEALLKRWGQLGRWIDEGRDELVILAEVRPAAERWERQGRQLNDTWTGTALHDARRVLLREGADCVQVVRDFLLAGVTREARDRRRRRLLLTAGIGTLIAGTIGAVFSSVVISREKKQAVIAQSRAERSSAEVLLEAAEGALQSHEGGKAAALIRASLVQLDSLRGRAMLLRSAQENARWTLKLAGAPDLRPIEATPFVASRSDLGRIHVIDERTGLGRWLLGQSDVAFAFAMPRENEFWSLSKDSLWRWNFRERRGESWMNFPPGSLREGGVINATATTAFAMEAQNILEIDVVHKSITRHAMPAGVGQDITVDSSGRYIAVSLLDLTVRLFQRTPWREIVSLPFEEGTRPRPAFASHSSALLYVNGNSVRHYRLSDGAVTTLAEGVGPVDRLLVVADSDRFMLSRRAVHRAELWRMGERDPEQLVDLEGGEYLRSVSANGDGYWTANLVTGEVHRTRFRRGESLTGLARDWGGQGVISAAFSADERTIVAGVGQNFVRFAVSDPSTVVEVDRAQSPIASVAVSSDDQWEVFAETLGALTVRHRHRSERRRFLIEQNWPFGLAFSNANQLLAVGGNAPRVGLWQVGTFTQLPSLELHRDGTKDVSFSPNDEQLLTGTSLNGGVQVWNLATNELAHEVVLGTRGSGAAWDHTATHQAICVHGELGLHDSSTNVTRRTRLSDRAFWPAFSPDGAWVAVGGGDGLVAAVRWDDPDVRREYVGHRRAMEVNHVRYSRDGHLLLSASDDGTVRLWNAETTMPLWRTPAVLRAPLRSYTQRGWQLVTDTPSSPNVSGALAQQIATVARDVVQSPHGGICLRRNDGATEYWDSAENTARNVIRERAQSRAVAFDGGCAAIHEGVVHVVDSQSHRTFGASVTALGFAENALLVATSEKLEWRAFDGSVLRSVDAPAQLLLVQSIHGGVLAGSATGELYWRAREAARFSELETRSLSTHLPTVFLQGPEGSVFVGFDDGTIVLFDLSSRRPLWRRRVYGSVQHVAFEVATLHVWSDLGVHMQESFALLTGARAEVLTRAALESPGIWTEGEIVLRP